MRIEYELPPSVDHDVIFWHRHSKRWNDDWKITLIVWKIEGKWDKKRSKVELEPDYVTLSTPSVKIKGTGSKIVSGCFGNLSQGDEFRWLGCSDVPHNHSLLQFWRGSVLHNRNQCRQYDGLMDLYSVCFMFYPERIVVFHLDLSNVVLICMVW